MRSIMQVSYFIIVEIGLISQGSDSRIGQSIGIMDLFILTNEIECAKKNIGLIGVNNDARKSRRNLTANYA